MFWDWILRNVPLRSSFFPYFMRLLIRPMQPKIFPGNIRRRYLWLYFENGHHGHSTSGRLDFYQLYNGESYRALFHRRRDRPRRQCFRDFVNLFFVDRTRPYIVWHCTCDNAQGVCWICAKFPKLVLRIWRHFFRIKNFAKRFANFQSFTPNFFLILK